MEFWTKEKKWVESHGGTGGSSDEMWFCGSGKGKAQGQADVHL